MSAKTVVFILVAMGLVVPAFGHALEPIEPKLLNLVYPTFPGTPDINNKDNQNLAGIVAWLYTLIVGISGLAAFVIIVYGGIRWMASSGNPAQTADAKDRIKNALLGLLLILVSFLILQVINPDLVQLQNP